MGEWSTDTRDLVAATIAAHTQDIKGRTGVNGGTWGSIGCSCGHHVVDVKSAADVLRGMREHGEHVADAVLTSLTDAGALLPARGIRCWQVSWENADPRAAREVWCTCVSVEDARLAISQRPQWSDRYPRIRWSTDFPDGSVYYGPWREVADG